MAGASEAIECPLCLEELDETDKSFFPCKCNYRVCLWCYHHIKDNLNGKCPACRAPYDESNLTFIPPDPEELAKKKEDEARERERPKKAAGGDVAVGSAGAKGTLPKRPVDKPDLERPNSTVHRDDIPQSRRHLANVRVMQKNLVYIIGLTLNVAKEDILRSKALFGKFGKIVKIVINKSALYNSNSTQGPTVSAYITYQRRYVTGLIMFVV